MFIPLTKAFLVNVLTKSSYTIRIITNTKTYFSSITANELREVMKTSGDYMTNEDIEEMVRHADKNGDGTIDYEGISLL